MKSVLDKSFKGKNVLVRVDFNVPLDDKNNITDDNRIQKSLPTIRKLMSDGAKIILMSHLGRPNRHEDCFSLKHVVRCLSGFLGVDVSFSESCYGEGVLKKIRSMNSGEVLLLENLRFFPEENSGDLNFAKKLSLLADVYVNDAFGSAHRNHASTSIIAQFFPKNKYSGLLFKKEVDVLERVFVSNKKPCTAIIGGAKISGKITVISSLLEKVDNLIVGGGMAYTFVKAIGGKTGASLVENEKVLLAKSIISKSQELGVNFLLPIDSINANNFNNQADIISSNIITIKEGYMGLDIGEKSIELFSDVIESSKTIIWNGPMGVFEMSNFENGTKSIAKSICKATEKGAFSLVGGGDSIAAIKKFGMKEKVSYLSTGGGAMLKYLEGEGLPSIKSLL